MITKNLNQFNKKIRSVFFIAFAFSVVLLFSCTKEVKMKLPAHEPKIVLNCIFSTDSNIEVFLHKSSGIFENHNPWIQNAIVKLYENNIFVEQLNHEQMGLYVSDIIANESSEYKIEVFCDGFDMVKSNDFAPKKPVLIDAVYRDSIYFDAEDKYPVSQLKITIIDNPNMSNFYEVKLQTKGKPTGSSYSEINDVNFRKNADPVLLNENMFDYYPKTILFSDKLFNGKTHTINIDYRGTIHINNGIYQPYDYELIVHVRSVSENYFNYKKTLYKHLFNQESNVWDGSGDPIQMYSNISGGYGIFSAYSEIKVILRK